MMRTLSLDGPHLGDRSVIILDPTLDLLLYLLERAAGRASPGRVQVQLMAPAHPQVQSAYRVLCPLLPPIAGVLGDPQVAPVTQGLRVHNTELVHGVLGGTAWAPTDGGLLGLLGQTPGSGHSWTWILLELLGFLGLLGLGCKCEPRSTANVFIQQYSLCCCKMPQGINKKMIK